MFRRHVIRELSAYAHGELSAEESGRVSAHLLRCGTCRTEFDEIKLGIRLAESLPPCLAPPSLWDGIESALAKNPPPAPSSASITLSQPSWLSMLTTPRRVAAYCTLLVAVGSLCVWWFYQRPPRAAWEVARIEGTPTIDSDRIDSTGRLAIGEWLETDEASRAKIKVANIGQVEIDPGSRVRLVETHQTEHRLELERGKLHALIWAPPRLFFVDTPSAVAADLGCAYTLEVDDRGRGLLHVTSGWVALETPNRESVVPAGGACITQPGIGPGTPFFEDASETFVKALAEFDFEKGAIDPLNIVLAESRSRDTLTLWHLLSRVDDENRSRVYRRLAALAPPSDGITREGVMKLDKEMLSRWKAQLEIKWAEESIPAARKVWRGVWE
ncbi:MAG TPA: FecR domain-containing protein [Pyrinomonadaceae bacterium]|nr:FecR domain-containing protein [Pyrinomonadaceae bacterium]